jgi:hypothetical protein
VVAAGRLHRELGLHAEATAQRRTSGEVPAHQGGTLPHPDESLSTGRVWRRPWAVVDHDQVDRSVAAAGVGLGSLLRSQLAAIVTVFVWGFVIEQIIGGLFDSTQPYLPYTAATTMAGAILGGGTSPLPFAAATALVAGVAALLSAVATQTTVQRDIA